MHNHNDKSNSSMMWMMLPCLLILVFAIFAGGRGLRSWPFLAIIGAMVVAHLWMMFRGHGSGGEDSTNHEDHNASEVHNVEPASQEKKGHSSHSCCY